MHRTEWMADSAPSELAARVTEVIGASGLVAVHRLIAAESTFIPRAMFFQTFAVPDSLHCQRYANGPVPAAAMSNVAVPEAQIFTGAGCPTSSSPPEAT
ncbi:MAG: hypothetical protein ACREJD_15920 [Phycisphaerales bacterium]